MDLNTLLAANIKYTNPSIIIVWANMGRLIEIEVIPQVNRARTKRTVVPILEDKVDSWKQDIVREVELAVINGRVPDFPVPDCGEKLAASPISREELIARQASRKNH